MQIFFAVSCLLAVLALSNGASVAPKSEQPRAEVEAQITETTDRTRAVQAQANEQVVSDGAATEHKSAGTKAMSRKQRSLHRLRLGCHHRPHGGCLGSSCGAPVAGCAGVGCNTGCGGATPCQPNTVVVQRDVPVAQVVHQNVPVPQPVAVPVVKVVRVPVPVVSPPRPCCSQPQPCCGQTPLPCSPCSG